MGFYIGQKKEPRRSSVIITRAQGVSNGIPESVYYIIFLWLSKILNRYINKSDMILPEYLDSVAPVSSGAFFLMGVVPSWNPFNPHLTEYGF